MKCLYCWTTTTVILFTFCLLFILKIMCVWNKEKDSVNRSTVSLNWSHPWGQLVLGTLSTWNKNSCCCWRSCWFSIRIRFNEARQSFKRLLSWDILCLMDSCFICNRIPMLSSRLLAGSPTTRLLMLPLPWLPVTWNSRKSRSVISIAVDITVDTTVYHCPIDNPMLEDNSDVVYSNCVTQYSCSFSVLLNQTKADDFSG